MKTATAEIPDIIHVYPTDDRARHDLSGTTCWCGPGIDIQPNGVIIVIHEETTLH